MSDKDRPNLLAVLDAINQIESYTSKAINADEFFENRIVFDATLMNFVVIGEMSARLSASVTSRHSEVEWVRIRAFRNLIAHEYLGIDAEEVWQIVHADIPLLRDQIRRIIEMLPEV